MRIQFLCPELATREIERVRRFKNFTIKALRKPWKRDGSISIEIPHGRREPLPFINEHADAIMLSKHLQEIRIIRKTKI